MSSVREGINQPAALGVGLPPTVARWAILALLMAIAGLSHLDRISISTAGNQRIMALYGIEPTQMGWIYSAFLITYTTFMIPGGWVIDRFGAKAALIVVGLGLALFEALTGVVGLTALDAGSAFMALLVIRGLMGIASAPLHPACARVVGQWFPAGGRSRANGLVTGAALGGIAATPPVFGALIARYDWPAAFLIAGAVTAGMALVWTLAGANHPMRPEASAVVAVAGALPARRSTLASRSLVLLTISYGAVGYFQYLFFYWMGYYFQKVLELPERTSRRYEAILPLAMALGMPLGGWLSDRLERALGAARGRRITPMAGMGAGAVLLALGVQAREPAWIVTWFALALGAVGTAEGPFWATAIELGGRRGGRSAAFFNTGGNAGGILAPIVTPWIGQRYGWPWALALGGAVCLLGVVLWVGIDPGGRPDGDEPPGPGPAIVPDHP